MTRFATIAAAALLAYGFSSIPAFAGPVLQGISVNGMRMNGALLQGISVNGMRMNGVAQQAAPALPALQAVTLGDGTRLAVQQPE